MARLPILLVMVLLLVFAPVASSAGNITTVASFNPAAGQLPEGLAIDGAGNLYAAFAPIAAIVKITPSGSVSTFAILPPPAPGGFLVGLAFDPAGEYLYAALASFIPATHGIWRVKRDGTGLELFAALDPTGLPNGLAFRGSDLYASDSALGKIYKINAVGLATTWVQDALLESDHSPGPIPGLFVGANGVAFRDAGSPGRTDYLYADNTDRGIIVRIAVQPDGSAGPVENFVSNPTLLRGADGLTSFGGNLYVAINRSDRILRVNPSGHITVVAEGAPLQFPASVVVSRGQLYATNLAFPQVLGLDPRTPNPAVLRMPLGG